MEANIPAEPEPISLDTERTALIVVDMQNAFAKKGGMLDILGAFNEVRANLAIINSKRIIEVFRHKSMPVIYLRMTYGPDLAGAGGPDSPNYWKESGLRAMRQRPEWKGKFLTIDTWDWEIIDELKPLPVETVINKSRYSGFVKTELDSVLKSHKIKYIVFIGIATNVCVESTLRDAYFHEYFPVLVGDACSNIGPDFIQEATIWNVTSVFGWVTATDSLIEALDSS